MFFLAPFGFWLKLQTAFIGLKERASEDQNRRHAPPLVALCPGAELRPLGAAAGGAHAAASGPGAHGGDEDAAGDLGEPHGGDHEGSKGLLGALIHRL